jgi:hypothetical protein
MLWRPLAPAEMAGLRVISHSLVDMTAIWQFIGHPAAMIDADPNGSAHRRAVGTHREPAIRAYAEADAESAPRPRLCENAIPVGRRATSLRR